MRFMLALGLAAIASTPAQSAVPLAPGVKKDVQCFLLYAIAAGAAKDEKTTAGAAAGTMYYLGRIDMAEPTLDLAEAVQQEAQLFEKDQKAGQAIGAACDRELSTRGQQMMALGSTLMKAGK